MASAQNGVPEARRSSCSPFAASKLEARISVSVGLKTNRSSRL